MVPENGQTNSRDQIRKDKKRNFHRFQFDINADSSNLVWFHSINSHQSPWFILGYKNWSAVAGLPWRPILLTQLKHLIFTRFFMWLFSLNSIPHLLHVEGEEIWRFAAGGLVTADIFDSADEKSRARPWCRLSKRFRDALSRGRAGIEMILWRN